MHSKPEQPGLVHGAFSEVRLVNGSVGDPALFVDTPGRDDALLFDAGENATLDSKRLGDLRVVLLSHHHIDHFIGFDRVVRANLDRDKTLQVYGPEGTIRKVYRRIKSYEYPFFPFQKLVMNVHDVLVDRLRSATLDCSRRFPRPEVREDPWTGPVIYESGEFAVEAAHVVHTIPCLAFALLEKPGLRPDPRRLAAGPPDSRAWVGQVLRLVRAGAPPDTTVAIQNESFRLDALVSGYFTRSAGGRIAYVTDTVWDGQTRPVLLRLAAGADRLYCDSFYAHEHLAQARKYRHMTATQAAELAREAGVDELVLIHFSARYEGRYDSLVAEARAIFPRVVAEIPPTPQQSADSGEPPPATAV